MKITKQLIRKNHMKPIKNTIELIEIKDPNIRISQILGNEKLIGILEKLNYPKMIKYRVQKDSEISIPDCQ